MRDKERIQRITNLIFSYWSRYPNLRFNQLVDSLQWEYCNTVNKFHLVDYAKIIPSKSPIKGFTVEEFKAPDLFYLEDDKFEKFLISKVNE